MENEKKWESLNGSTDNNNVNNANIPDTNTPNFDSQEVESSSTPYTVQEPQIVGRETTPAEEISVNISDPSPIIILFGAGASGKTMTLVRLTRWLLKQGYRVEPDRAFRPSSSQRYQELCDRFEETINSNTNASRTAVLDFMLVRVMNKYGEPICQILEAPGEHYFDPSNPTAPFPYYINAITQLDNFKTWMFIIEYNWKDAKDRMNYAAKIRNMQALLNPDDRVIFTCHKADLHPSLFVNGMPNTEQFFRNVQNQYQGIFTNYENRNPISKLWRKYNFDFVVFSAGRFSKSSVDSGVQIYTQSNDRYPDDLWRAIMKTVKGSW